MPWAEDVPWPQDGRIETAGAQERFALAADFDIGAHHRGRLRHADINEVTDACRGCRGNGCSHGNQIDCPELRRFSRAGMGYADQLDKGVARRNRGNKRVLFQRVSRNLAATRRQFSLGAGSY